MKLFREILFLSAAVGLAVAWYALLLIPWATRKMLLADPWPRFLILAVIAALFALIFRRWTARSFSMERGAAMALLVPVFGAALFSSVLAIGEWGSRGASAVALVLGALWTLVYVLGAAYYIVLPMGVITVVAMRKLALALWPQPRVAEGEEFWW